MDRDIRVNLLLIGASAVVITVAGLSMLVFGASGISAEMGKNSRDGQLERYGQNMKSRMATKLKAYMRTGASDYIWASGAAPFGTNVTARAKYGWFTHTNGNVVGWARLKDGTVIGYNERPFRYVDGHRLYMFGAGIAMVAMLFVTLCACGWRLAGAAKRAREDLEQKESFLNMISHELNTPLASIVPLASALSAGTIADGRRRAEALDTLRRESERMARMIGELLTVVRLRNGRTSFSLVRVDLADVASSAANLMRVRYPDSAILVHDGDAVFAEADRDKVEQVAINLIENACRYAGNGAIEVECRECGGGKVALEVSDRGPGIPPENAARIFERFYQEDAGGGASGGLGLGLAIVAGLVAGMGGTVSVGSRDGGGSVFAVQLPAAERNHEGDAADG